VEYFPGLDVSMAETHICVMTRNGAARTQRPTPRRNRRSGRRRQQSTYLSLVAHVTDRMG
jgi:hypothetical protein